MSVVELLRLNDPAGKDISIDLRRETSDADLAQALEQNQFVTCIRVDLEGEQRPNWDSLLRVIATRDKLEKVFLWDAESTEDRTATTAALVREFLQAIPRNTAIRRCRI